MDTVIVIAIIVIIVGAAAGYIIKAKKSGRKCIGCPDSKTCNAKSSAGGTCCCCCSYDKNEQSHADSES